MFTIETNVVPNEGVTRVTLSFYDTPLPLAITTYEEAFSLVEQLAPVYAEMHEWYSKFRCDELSLAELFSALEPIVRGALGTLEPGQ